MKIIKLVENIGNLKERLVFDIEKKDNILFTSSENSEGKTTAIRSIIFCLGFNVNIISDIYDDLKPKLSLFVELPKGIIKITRTLSKGELIFIEANSSEKMYDMRNDEEADAFARVLGFDNYEFMNSMLGAFYIDQDFGWKYINHGRIHPNRDMKFKFNSLLSSMVAEKSWADVNGVSSEIASLSKQISVIKNLTEMNIQPSKLSLDDKVLMRKLSNLSASLANVDNKIKNKKALDDDFKKFFVLLSSNSTINSVVGDSKKNILNQIRQFENTLSDEEIVLLEKRKVSLHMEIANVKNKLNNKSTLFSNDSHKLLKNALSIAVSLEGKDSSTVLSAELDGLEERRDNLKLYKRRIDKKIVSIKKNYYDQINLFIEKITGTKTKITQSKLFADSTSSDFDQISGAKKAFFVLVLRYLLITLYRRKTGISLPMIIDTPSTFDPANNSIEDFVKLLKSVSKHHQLISAGVSKNINESIGKIGLTKIEKIENNFKEEIILKNDQVTIDEILDGIESINIDVDESDDNLKEEKNK